MLSVQSYRFWGQMYVTHQKQINAQRMMNHGAENAIQEIGLVSEVSLALHSDISFSIFPVQMEMHNSYDHILVKKNEKLDQKKLINNKLI